MTAATCGRYNEVVPVSHHLLGGHKSIQIAYSIRDIQAGMLASLDSPNVV